MAESKVQSRDTSNPFAYFNATVNNITWLENTGQTFI